MSKEKQGPAPRRRRKPMAVFYWEDEWKELIAKVSNDIYGVDVSKAVRGILEEVVSCFMSDEELRALKKPQYITYPPPRLMRALLAAKENRKAGEQPGDSKNRI